MEWLGISSGGFSQAPKAQLNLSQGQRPWIVSLESTSAESANQKSVPFSTVEARFQRWIAGRVCSLGVAQG